MDLDTESMTVIELKKELKSRSLKLSGRKSELQERLRAAIEAEVIEESSTDNPHTDFADFEEYINDEYNRLNKGQQNESNQSLHDHHDTLTIDDIINNTDDTDATATVTATDTQPQAQPSTQEDVDEADEKDVILQEDETPGAINGVMADFNDDPNALNTKSKMEDRMKRFGINPKNETQKVDSRKRRFESPQNSNEVVPPAKKQKLNREEERSKIVQRALKFGTNVPKKIKLTQEESALIYAEQITRAKRFGTEHLLPKHIKRAELNAKKEERKKRFKTEEATATKEENKKVAAVQEPKKGGTKLMERKLRFGTLNDIDKALQRQERFGTKAKMNKNKNKNKRQNGRKRGRGRGRNNRMNNGRRGAGNNNANRGRGARGARGRGRGRNNGYNNNNNNNNANGQRFQHKNGKNLHFSQEDMQKINDRKSRFTAMSE